MGERADFAAFKALAAEQTAPGPCNRRCREYGRCAFGRSDPAGSWCRERRPPRRAEYAPSDTPGDPP